MVASAKILATDITTCFLGVHASKGRTVVDILAGLQLEHLSDNVNREEITVDVLIEMTDDDLKSIGISAFGNRHKILKKSESSHCQNIQVCRMLCHWHG